MKSDAVKEGLMRRLAHYDALAIFVVMFHIIFLKYVLPREWADAAVAKALVSGVAAAVPAVASLQTLDIYTNYLGLFYATFWLMMPLLAVIGFVGKRSLIGKGFAYARSREKEWAVVLMFFFMCLLLWPFFSPIEEFGSCATCLVNLASDVLVVRLYSWGLFAGCAYMAGAYARLAWFKYRNT